MDIDKEFAAANRRIQLGIERDYLIAMAKLEGMTPQEYAAKVDAERAAQILTAAQENARAIGRAYGEMYRSLQEAVENISIGFREAFNR